jgi:hypothetical protein
VSCEVVANGTDAAQALHHHRQLPERPALHELLEAAELDDVQSHLMDAVVRVEQDRHLAVALDAGHGVDRDAAHAGLRCCGFEVDLHSRLQS